MARDQSFLEDGKLKNVKKQECVLGLVHTFGWQSDHRW